MQKENFVKCDWSTQIFRRKKNFKVENFQLLTMTFSKNVLSVEIFLERKWAFKDDWSVAVFVYAMVHSPINQNFELNKSRQKFHHSLKEHHKISNIPKFRCKML